MPIMLCAFIRRPTVADQMNQKQSAADSALSPPLCFVEMPLTALQVAVRSHEDLMNAISLNSSIVNGARVVGPAVTGLLMAYVGITWCFILNGVSFIAVIVGLWMMRLPKFVPPKKTHSTGRHILEGFIYVAGHRRVRILMLLFGVVGVFGWSYSVLLPVYATDILHVNETGYGVLLSADGFGALLGALTVAT